MDKYNPDTVKPQQDDTMVFSTMVFSTMVFSRFQMEGIHRWKKCPIEEVSYLREYHRHVFHFEVRAVVNHTDRDIEFIEFSHQIQKFLHQKYYDQKKSCLFFDDMSCEMIAQELMNEFPIICEAIVSEDGEGGSIVTRKEWSK